MTYAYNNLFEIQAEFDNWNRMSTRPTGIKKLKEGTVIDEEKSIRWNKEEVERNNKAYSEEVSRLSTIKNKARDDMYEKIYGYIMLSVGDKCTRKKARYIWNKAYDRGHSYGIDKIIIYLEEYMHFAIEMLSTEKEVKK